MGRAGRGGGLPVGVLTGRQTNAGHPLQVNHDVGVFVLAPAKVKELREPCCPTPDASRSPFNPMIRRPLTPPLSALHHPPIARHAQRPREPSVPSRAARQRLGEQRKHATAEPGERLTFPPPPLRQQGTLTFSVENDGMQLDTTWTNLSIPPFSELRPRALRAESHTDNARATNSESTDDAEPRPTQLANLDLTESQKTRRAQDAKGNVADGAAERAPTDQMFQVTIGTKSLLKFLSTNVSNSGTIACESRDAFLLWTLIGWPGICDDYCLICYIYIGAYEV